MRVACCLKMRGKLGFDQKKCTTALAAGAQEFGNVEYVVDNGYGIFERAPERIAARLSAWFSTERAELDAIAKRCAQVASRHPGGGATL